MLVTSVSALRCYTCNRDNDNKCKGEDPELASLAYAVDPDEDEFRYCAKISYGQSLQLPVMSQTGRCVFGTFRHHDKWGGGVV